MIPKEKLSLEIKHLIKAPRDRVYDAWTDPAQLKQWFGPEGVHSPFVICASKRKEIGL
jgi:uncharacterized protein YndB with AHSA1/START domain